jgi:ABC-type oligopeptide transport system substrate-binding subunit
MKVLVSKIALATSVTLATLITAGAASAQSPRYRADPQAYRATVQHEPSSTNPQAGGGAAGYLAPHEVPENGGAASTVLPGFAPN